VLFSVSLIVFGRLGKAASISFSSIKNLSPARICVVGDLQGIEWIRSESIHSNVGSICLHEPKGFLESNLNLNSNNSYVNFGDERFIRLTTQKWIVIEQALKHDDIDFTVFSDLDILWTVGSNKTLLSEISKSSNIAIFAQNDPKNILSANPYYCTGIMVWKKSEENLEALNKLHKLQLEDFRTGKLTPDEPIFNRFARANAHKSIALLNKEYFVIGNRFFHLCISLGLHVNKIAAFHANYVVGESRKLRRLMAVVKLSSGRFPYFIFTQELTIYLLKKLAFRFKK